MITTNYFLTVSYRHLLFSTLSNEKDICLMRDLIDWCQRHKWALHLAYERYTKYLYNNYSMCVISDDNTSHQHIQRAQAEAGPAPPPHVLRSPGIRRRRPGHRGGVPCTGPPSRTTDGAMAALQAAQHDADW
jgi:hypothetical protein